MNFVIILILNFAIFCANCEKIIVRKCCPLHQELYAKKCIQSDKPFDIEASFDFEIASGSSCPAGKRNLRLIPEYDLFNISGGGVLIARINKELPDYYFNWMEYCVDFIDNKTDLNALICMAYEEPDVVSGHLYNTGMIISMPFLFTTFLVYALLPERNLHMKALMCYVFSLLMSYIVLVTNQLSKVQYSESVCEFLGLFCVFWFILSCLWMNVICIDIWFTFSGYAGFSGQSKKAAENKRFFMYCAYAVGVASLHTIIIKCINSMGNLGGWYHPGVGNGQCFIGANIPLLLYFYGPMAIIIIINIILFAITAWRIRSVQKENKIFKKEDSRSHNQDKKKFVLYLKLLAAMGLNWSMEVISWAAKWGIGTKTIPSYVWYFPDFCNAIYGVCIFFLFVFKRKILNMLQKRYYTFRGRPHMACATFTDPTRTSNYYSNTDASVSEHHIHRDEDAIHRLNK